MACVEIKSLLAQAILRTRADLTVKGSGEVAGALERRRHGVGPPGVFAHQAVVGKSRGGLVVGALDRFWPPGVVWVVGRCAGRKGRVATSRRAVQRHLAALGDCLPGRWG